MAFDAAALHALCSSSSVAAKILDAHLAGELGDGERATVDETIEVTGASRRDTIDGLKAIGSTGAGEFKVGRKGHPTRLEWLVDIETLEDAVAGRIPVQRSPRIEVDEQPSLGLYDHVDDDSTAGDADIDDASEVVPIAAVTMRPEVRSAEVRSTAVRSERESNGHVDHVHRLRPDLEIHVSLPVDLSPREAEILGDWIRNLSFDR